MMNNLPEKPIFIVGHPRSGTTLLRFMLSSHPRLFIPEETGFIPFLVNKNKINRPLSPSQVAKILDRIGRLNYLWKDAVKDVTAFYQGLSEQNLACVIDSLIRYHTTDQPVIRWGDKTPLYVQYIPVIHAIFPQAQFIHLIRDGRDAALSARKKWPERSYYMNIHYLLKNWVRNVNTGQLAEQILGAPRYLEMQYEALVAHPQESIEIICKFLDEKPHPAMLDHTVLANKIGPGPDHHTEVLKPVSTASIGQWKLHMTSFEKKVADYVAGSTLEGLGYELADIGPLSPRERLHLVSMESIFAAVDSLRDLLYKTGFLTLNRTMRKG